MDNGKTPKNILCNQLRISSSSLVSMQKHNVPRNVIDFALHKIQPLFKLKCAV